MYYIFSGNYFLYLKVILSKTQYKKLPNDFHFVWKFFMEVPPHTTFQRFLYGFVLLCSGSELTLSQKNQ